MRSPFAPIPTAKTGMDAFWEGLQNSQKLFDSLSQNRLNAQKLAQQQQLLPYLLQEYKDTHAKLPFELKHLAAQTGASGAAAQASLAAAGLHGAQRKAAEQAILEDQFILNKMKQSQAAGRNAAANQPSTAGPIHSEEEEEIVPNQPGQKPAGMPPGLQEMQGPQAGMQPSQQSQIQQPPMAPQGTPQQQEMQTPQTGNLLQPHELKLGQTQVIDQGNPNDYYLDDMARSGMKSSSGRIAPSIERKVSDGIQYEIYPSGKITARKVGPSDTEKQELKEALAEKRKSNEINLKDASEIKKQTHALAKPYQTLLEMKEIMKKHPELTGWGPGAMVRLKRNKDPDLARFDYLSGNLQTEFAKAFGPRAGAQIAKLYERIKPSTFNQGQANTAMIDQGLDLLDDYIKDNQSEYKDLKNRRIKI